MRLNIHIHHHPVPDPAIEQKLDLISTMLANFGRTIMSKISEFSAAVNAHFARQAEAITGIKADVDSLKAKIDALQNSQGELSAEDQAALDDIQVQAGGLADRLSVLDAETAPPAPPPEG